MSLKFCITYIDVNKVDCKKISNLFTKISKVTNTILKIKPNYLFDVGLVASEFIQKINKEHRHIDKPTDVLSFALHDTNPKTQLLGEIFINWDDCVLNINKYQHLSLLFTHGLLHLLQFNHNTPKNEKQMNILQNKIITLLK